MEPEFDDAPAACLPFRNNSELKSLLNRLTSSRDQESVSTSMWPRDSEKALCVTHGRHVHSRLSTEDPQPLETDEKAIYVHFPTSDAPPRPRTGVNPMPPMNGPLDLHTATHKPRMPPSWPTQLTFCLIPLCMRVAHCTGSPCHPFSGNSSP